VREAEEWSVTPTRSARFKDRTYGADQAVYHVIDRFRGLGTGYRETGMRVAIPMLVPLKATIDVGPTGDLAYIVTRRRTPFNKGALGTAFLDAARAGGVRGKSAHGLRKAAATRATENGATEREPDAIFGWSGGRMATLYTKSANRSRLAAGAISKLDRAETENRTSILAPSAEVRAEIRKIE
jgi:hypothetical protein